MTRFLIASALAVTAWSAAPPDPRALELLSKASAAFERNREFESRWNWTTTERREIAGKSGAVLQEFPAVTAESVIRSDGGRCNAVVAWGDGLEPYKAHAEASERCRAMEDFRAPFEVSELLKSSQARIVEWWEKGAELAILPDKARQKSDDPAVRCAASIEAVVQLDPASMFPKSIEGKVVGDGCEVRQPPLIQYGRPTSVPMRAAFRKGASFRMTFAFQNDRFGNASDGFWVCASQHYLMPWDASNTELAYWGRRVPVTARGNLLVKDIETKAQEFGASSRLGF
jgi:hypothetical protein